VSATVGSLTELGAALGMDGAALEAFAAQDQIGGVDTGWYNGSLWSAEGKVLYALARALNVQRAVEFGTWRGCSASHIAQAIHDAYEAYEVDEPGQLLECVDVWESAGADIPIELRPFIRMTYVDMCDYAAKAVEYGTQYELIFEDGPHDEGTVQFVWERARDLLVPGGVIISHDALHDSAGPHVRAGIEASGITPIYVSVGGSDCGLAVWRRD
jgi:predicted O-methyltransferase YrrM